MKRICTVLWSIVFVILFSCALYAGDEAVVGDPCPDITLNDIQTNQAINVNEISAGKVTVIAYFQSTCAPCRKTLAGLNSILNDFPDLYVIAISVDTISTKRLVHQEQFQYLFLFLHDPFFYTPELFGFAYTPSIAILDKCGNIIHLNGGWKKDTKEKIIPFIEEAAAEDGLIVEACSGNVDGVKLLIATGADINATDKYGRSALSYAKKKGHKEVVELLEKAAAKKSAESEK